MEIFLRKKGVYTVHVKEEQERFFDTVEKLGIDTARYRGNKYTWPDMTCLFVVDTKKKILEYNGQPSICAAIVGSGVKLWSVDDFTKEVMNSFEGDVHGHEEEKKKAIDEITKGMQK